MDYKIVYSERKTVGITVKDGQVTVKAPRRAPKELIAEVVKKHEKWIRDALIRDRARRESFPELTDDEIKQLRKAARVYFEERCRYFGAMMNAQYTKITITGAKTRFGSCSSKKSLSFSYRLMLYPPEAREYVVVHELAHLSLMNHSPAFYAIIERYLPDYKKRRKLLKV